MSVFNVFDKTINVYNKTNTISYFVLFSIFVISLLNLKLIKISNKNDTLYMYWQVFNG